MVMQLAVTGLTPDREVRLQVVHARLLVRPVAGQKVFIMTINLALTDFALAITHDLSDQLCAFSTICPRFKLFSIEAQS